MVGFGAVLGRFRITRGVTSLLFNYRDSKLEQDILGIHFPNPVGLAAGFDKNAQMVGIMPVVGFGFTEVGSVTGEPCEGNPKPRMWRLPDSKSIVVNYGLMNDGAKAIARRLRGQKHQIPVGVSVAKTNNAATAQDAAGIADYVKALTDSRGAGDYFTINISCPNAYGGEPFTDPKRLEKLLTKLDQVSGKKPRFIKLSPDLSENEVGKLIQVAEKHRIDGYVCTNLTKKRNNPRIVEDQVPERGGLSGRVVEELSNALITQVYRLTDGKKIIVGCGGIFTAEDAYRKIRLGASLVQLITGMIYEGPQAIGEINHGLVKLLERDGFKSIGEAVGADSK
jgi:dihydroorotate dehydrogenase